MRELLEQLMYWETFGEGALWILGVAILLVILLGPAALREDE